MLAENADLSKIVFPKLASPKIDGIRTLAMSGIARSRTMKPLPNRFIAEYFATHATALEGLDGELVVGPVNAPNVYTTSTSGIMTAAWQPDFTYFVFDCWNQPGRFADRIKHATRLDRSLARVHLLDFVEVHNLDQLVRYEEAALANGFEGVMLRDPNSPYKQGRSTLNEGYLLKVKRFSDAEAVIIGFEEEMNNGNQARIDELGRTKRSSHKANLTAKGTLGALVVRGLTAFDNVVFNIGSGFDAATRASFWNNRDELLGRIVAYTYFNVGVKDLPRMPVYKGLRSPIDL
jgi:DNA ligase-1